MENEFLDSTIESLVKEVKLAFRDGTSSKDTYLAGFELKI